MSQQTSFSAVLGVVIANHRKLKMIDQAPFAARMGLSQASYSRLESGKAVFSIEHLYQVAEILEVSAQQLLEEVDRYRASLQREHIQVQPAVRANSSQAKEQEGAGLGTFVAGAALGALIMSALTRK